MEIATVVIESKVFVCLLHILRPCDDNGLKAGSQVRSRVVFARLPPASDNAASSLQWITAPDRFVIDDEDFVAA